MAAVVTVSQRQIYSLIKAHLHRPAHQSTDGFFIVADGVFHILDLSSVAQFPETVLQILLFNRRNVLCHMTMEAVAHILPVRHIFNDAVLFTELLYLKAAEIFRRSRINGIQIAILFLKFLNLFIDMLQNLQRKLSIFYQRLFVIQLLKLIKGCDAKGCCGSFKKGLDLIMQTQMTAVKTASQ